MKVSAVIIDAHVHICPPDVRRNRERYLRGEPGFAAIYKDPKAELVGASRLVEAMDEHSVDRAVVFGFPWTREEHFRFNNDYVLEAAERFPDRLIPFCCLDPAHHGACAEIRRCLDAGARGLGELAFYQSGLDPHIIRNLASAAHLCAEASVPVMLHVNEPVGHRYPGKSPMNLGQLYELLTTYPRTRWILAHLGGGLPFFGFMRKEVPEVLARCWFDTAAMPFLYRPAALRAIADAAGIERVLFGTDYPLLPPSRYYRELESSGLSPEERRAVLGENALRALSPEERPSPP
jgi:hypothetical protein